MNLTLDIPDELLEKARRLASEEQTTVDALVEDGLRRILFERAPRPEFRLRKVSVQGNGLQPGVESMSWEQIREMIYGDRGG